MCIRDSALIEQVTDFLILLFAVAPGNEYLCPDAETENRRDKQEVPQAGRCHEEAAGSDGPVSYTHLEQTKQQRQSTHLTETSSIITYQKVESSRKVAQGHARSTIAVSYTHLRRILSFLSAGRCLHVYVLLHRQTQRSRAASSQYY